MNGMMENIRRRADLRRNTGAVRRTAPHRRYSGTKKAAHEKLARRKRPGAPGAAVVPAAASTREASDAQHRTINTQEKTRIAGESLLPKTVTLSPLV
jgi:hypothetical protein